MTDAQVITDIKVASVANNRISSTKSSVENGISMSGDLHVGFRVNASSMFVKMSAIVASATLVASMPMDIKGSAEYIAPNDFVKSCYGSGCWRNDLPYLNDDGWKNI